MQDASAEFATAVAKGPVVWPEPRLLADWLIDGASVQTGPARYVVDLFDDRTLTETWGRPDPRTPPYVHIDGNDDDYTVDGANGYATIAVQTFPVSRMTLARVNSDNMSVRVVWSTDDLFTGDGSSIVKVLMRDDGTGENHYAIQLAVKTAAGVPTPHEIVTTIQKTVGGVTSSLTTAQISMIHVAEHRYAIYLEIVGDTIRAKAWDTDIEIEPADWTVETTDSSITTGTYGGVQGFLAVAATNPTPFTYKFHELRILDGSIDDLSHQAGLITVIQTIDDGLPDAVSFAVDQGTSLLNAELTGKRGDKGSEYFSAFNERSPLYGIGRDVAPVTLDHGVITENGPERLRLFTGRMLDVVVQGASGQANMPAISDARLSLSQLVQPPPFNRRGDLSASWPVSWAMYQCGVYASPSPRTGCRFWAPMHGSLQPFIGEGMPELASYQGTFPDSVAGYYYDDGSLVIGDSDSHLNPLYGDDDERDTVPAYVDGPYVAAPHTRFLENVAWGIYYSSLKLVDGDDLLSEAGPRGRLEFAVRADDFVTTAPSGSDYTPDIYIAGMYLLPSSGSQLVHCGVNMSREPQIVISDGTVTLTLTWSAQALPTDGEWYKLGFAYDFEAEKVWLYKQDPDGTEHETSDDEATLDVTRLPSTDNISGAVHPFNTNLGADGFSPHFHAFIPVAELHLTAGEEANADDFPWIWETAYGWEASAIVKRSANRLLAMVEPNAREAWELIGMYAQAELASTRFDELDRACYLTLAHWAELAQQTAGQTLNTETNVQDLQPQSDPSRIRNQVRVTFRQSRLDTVYRPVYQSFEAIRIRPGTTVLTLPLQVLASELSFGDALIPSEAQIANGISGFSVGQWVSFVTLNTSADGTGTYYTWTDNPDVDEVSASVDEVFTAGEAVMTIINNTGLTLFTANDNAELPSLNIGGIGLNQGNASVTVRRTSSIDRRGIRGLTVDIPGVQRRDDARRLARRILNDLAEPSYTLENVRVFGDQRRQPGDLVTFTDARNTRVSGSWRLMRVNHVIDGATYYQDVRLRQALPVGVWGTTRWGQSIWGREA